MFETVSGLRGRIYRELRITTNNRSGCCSLPLTVRFDRRCCERAHPFDFIGSIHQPLTTLRFRADNNKGKKDTMWNRCSGKRGRKSIWREHARDCKQTLHDIYSAVNNEHGVVGAKKASIPCIMLLSYTHRTWMKSASHIRHSLYSCMEINFHLTAIRLVIKNHLLSGTWK